MGRAWRITGALLLSAWLMPATAGAVNQQYKGCETPVAGVTVCWSAIAGDNDPYSPFPELHLLPVTSERDGQEELLQDLTRQIYRQLLPGNLTARLRQHWNPVLYLEDAIDLAERKGWPVAVWIAPRVMRDSGPATPGLVDWDVYFINGPNQRLIRTLRVRAEALPQVQVDTLRQAVLAVGVLAATRALPSISAGRKLLAIGAVADQAEHHPPTAGQPLELLTELAVAQVIWLMQYPIGDLAPAPLPDGVGQGTVPGLPNPFQSSD